MTTESTPQELENVLIELLGKEFEDTKYTTSFRDKLVMKLMDPEDLYKRVFDENENAKKILKINSYRQFCSVMFMSTILHNLKVVPQNFIDIIHCAPDCLELEENINGFIMVLDIWINSKIEDGCSELFEDGCSGLFEDGITKLQGLLKGVERCSRTYITGVSDIYDALISIINELIKTGESKEIVDFEETKNILTTVEVLLNIDSAHDSPRDVSMIESITNQMMIMKTYSRKFKPHPSFLIIKSLINEGKRFPELFTVFTRLLSSLSRINDEFIDLHYKASSVFSDVLKFLYGNSEIFGLCNERLEKFKNFLDTFVEKSGKKKEDVLCSMVFGDVKKSLKAFRSLKLYHSYVYYNVTESVDLKLKNFNKILFENCIIKHDLLNKSFKVLSCSKFYVFRDYNVFFETINENTGEVSGRFALKTGNVFKFKTISDSSFELIEPPTIEGTYRFTLGEDCSILLCKENPNKKFRLFSNKVIINKKMRERSGWLDPEKCLPSFDDVLENLVLSTFEEYNIDNSTAITYQDIAVLKHNTEPPREMEVPISQPPLNGFSMTVEEMHEKFFELAKSNYKDIAEFVSMVNQNTDNYFNNPNVFETCLIFCFLYLVRLGFQFPNEVMKCLFENQQSNGNLLDVFKNSDYVGPFVSLLGPRDDVDIPNNATYGNSGLFPTLEKFIEEEPTLTKNKDTAVIVNIVSPTYSLLDRNRNLFTTPAHFVLIHNGSHYDPQQLPQNMEKLVVEYRVFNKVEAVSNNADGEEYISPSATFVAPHSTSTSRIFTSHLRQPFQDEPDIEQFPTHTLNYSLSNLPLSAAYSPISRFHESPPTPQSTTSNLTRISFTNQPPTPAPLAQSLLNIPIPSPIPQPGFTVPPTPINTQQYQQPAPSFTLLTPEQMAAYLKSLGYSVEPPKGTLNKP